MEVSHEKYLLSKNKCFVIDSSLDICIRQKVDNGSVEYPKHVLTPKILVIQKNVPPDKIGYFFYSIIIF